MKRDYADIEDKTESVVYFTGIEIEVTPAHNLLTLFVVGQQPVDEILLWAQIHKVKHIYLGANQCFAEVPGWNTLAVELMKEGYWVTLDYPVTSHEWVLNECSSAMECGLFIPQISVKIPHIQKCNYNTTIKIDDKDFKASNPGVWCWPLSDLLPRAKFTAWTAYTNDKIIKTTKIKNY